MMFMTILLNFGKNKEGDGYIYQLTDQTLK